MARHGFGIRFQVITETAQQYGSRWATAAVCVLLVIAVALLVVPWNNIFPLQAGNAPVAHTSPLPAVSPVPSSGPTQVIQVSGAGAGICIVPTSKAKRPLTLVKVP
jgi:hypothetical protein